MSKKIIVSWCQTCGRKLGLTHKGNWSHLAGGWERAQPACKTGPVPGGPLPPDYKLKKTEVRAEARELRAFKRRQITLPLKLKRKAGG